MNALSHVRSEAEKKTYKVSTEERQWEKNDGGEREALHDHVHLVGRHLYADERQPVIIHECRRSRTLNV
jgi:hypothetical protein